MEQEIRRLIKEAMIEKNETKKLTYKSILDNAQKLAKSDGNRAVTSADLVRAAKSEIKAQNDLLQYVEINSERAATISKIITYSTILLPQMASEGEIFSFLMRESIRKDIGACMKALKEKFGDTLDGKIAQPVVKKYTNKI